MRFIPLYGLIAVVACNSDNKTFEGHRVTHKVWFDMRIGGEEVGRIEIGLFGKIMPMAVKNFVTLARNPKGKGYKGSKFHLITELCLAGGDWVAGTGGGGRSGFESPEFEIENFKIKHYGAGWVSADPYPPFISSLFLITLKKVARFDGHCPVFGKVLRGMSVVWRISRIPVLANNMPKIDVIISDCGGDMVDPPFFVPKTDATD